jgi:protein SCO1/2
MLILFLTLTSFAWGQNYRGGIVEPPLPKPHFVLTDTNGAAFDFRKETDGSVALLFFGYTFCPDQCPMHMATLATAMKKLNPEIAGKVKLIFVTTDPQRDTAERLRQWLDNFDKRFIGLRGSEAEIEGVERMTGVPPARKGEPRNGGYSVSHANFVVAYTKDNLAHVIYPGGVSKDDWVHDLPMLIGEKWMGR